MKKTIALLISVSFLILLSCKANYREPNKDLFDISNALMFIESNIKNSNETEFEIFILYGHNNAKELKSMLVVKDEFVEIQTTSLTNSIIKIDTIFKLDKNKFLKELNYQKTHSKDALIFGGNYQFVFIKQKDKLIEYPKSVVARGLINLLEKGIIN